MAIANSEDVKAAISTANIAATKKSNSRYWFLDSGAREHFSPFEHLFDTLTDVKKPIEITTAKGTTYGRAIGSITISVMAGNAIHKVTLKNVVYVLGMDSNLLSIT